jgi:DNA-binding NarL/FixJ family response regulator
MTRVRDITRAIQILLADDQPLVRTAVRNLLESNPRFRDWLSYRRLLQVRMSLGTTIS